MATSTYLTFLMHGTGTSTLTYEKLLDIKEFPDLGGAPEMLDATTLTNKGRVYIPGIQENEALTFTTNYDPTEYAALVALANQDEPYAVWFGGTEGTGGADPTPTGSLGKFSFRGMLSVFVSGGGVNEVRDMTITIAPSTDITFAAT